MIISSINYFCSYTIGTVLDIEKLHVSKYLHCLVISQLINSTLSESLIIYLRYKFSECLLTTLLAAFLVFCSNLQWKMSQILSLHVRMVSFSILNQLQHLIECPSDILRTCFDFFNNLKVYKRILFFLKKTFFSCHKGLSRL